MMPKFMLAGKSAVIYIEMILGWRRPLGWKAPATAKENPGNFCCDQLSDTSPNLAAVLSQLE